MPGFDFRAANIQTRQIIATGSFDESGIAPSQIAIYPIEAQGTPVNQGEIESGLFGHLQSQDVFLYVSGAINGKGASTRGVSVFGGDLHVSGNFSIDGTGGGGGSGYSGSFPYRPTSSSFGTPIITGTITGGVTVTDVAGSSFGGVYDYVQIVATDPQAGSFVQIPITMPVTPLPDEFGVNFTFFTGAPPTDNFQAGLAFVDSTENRFWEFFHSVEVSSSIRPAIKILEVDTGVIGASWNFPDLGSMSNAVDVEATITKVSPFAATPQVQIEVNARNFLVHSASVLSKAVSANKTSGSISAGWVGEDFFGAQVVLVFLNTMSGSVNLFTAIEFVPTIRNLF